MKNIRIPAILLMMCFLTAHVPAAGKVRLPALIGNGMVLQQNSEATLWGRADPGKKITVKTSWGKEKYTATAAADSTWEVKVRTIAAGGPHRIAISDGETLVLDDIMLGEVWLCGGQSNMEMPMCGFMNQPVDGSTEALLEASGIKKELYCQILSLARKYRVEKLILFGSRARGDWRAASDIDLAVSGGDFPRFALDIEEAADTLLKFDMVNLNGPVQEELLDQIWKEGIVVYEKI